MSAWIWFSWPVIDWESFACIFTHGKKKLYITKTNKKIVKLQARGFSQRIFPQIITDPLLTICSWFCVSFTQSSCFVNTNAKSKLCTREGQQGDVDSDHWDVARRCDPGWCCKSIWCAQAHCSVPVDTLLRHRISSRPAAFWTASCDVTGAGCLHQGRAFAQSLPNYQSHCPYHPRTASYQWENCAEPPMCIRHPPSQTLCSAIIAATIVHGYNGRKTTRDGDLYSGKLNSSPMNHVFILMAVTDDKGSIAILGNAISMAASPNDVTTLVAVSWYGDITAHERTPLVILEGNLNGQRH